MSTTFGVRISEDEVIEVAFRSNGIRWTNKLAPFLPDFIPVEALDNTPQGIFTIVDIKREILKQDDTK